eukprot:928684-Pyramimonas_sp.AAC.1
MAQGNYCRTGSSEPTECPLLTFCAAGTAAPMLSFWEAGLDLLIFIIAGGGHWLATWTRDIRRYRRAVERGEVEQ